MRHGLRTFVLLACALVTLARSEDSKIIKPEKVYGDTYLRHQSAMSYYGLKLLPSKNQLVSLGWDGLRVWDLKAKKQLLFAPGDGAAKGFTVSPSGDRIALQTYESISIWSVKDKKLLFKTVFEKDNTLKAMDISRFLSESTLEVISDSQAYRWDWSKKALTKTWTVPKGLSPKTVLELENGRLIAVVAPFEKSRWDSLFEDEDGNVKSALPFETGVWDIRQKKMLWSSKARYFRGASPNGKSLACHLGTDWFLVDSVSGKIISDKVSVTDSAFPVWSGNDAGLIFGRNDFHMLDAKTGKAISKIPNPYAYNLKSIAWDYKDKKIYVGSDHTIFVHDLKGKLLHPTDKVFISGTYGRFAYRQKSDSVIIGENGYLVTVDLKTGTRKKAEVKEPKFITRWRFSPTHSIAAYGTVKVEDRRSANEEHITVADLSGKRLGQFESWQSSRYHEHFRFHPTKKQLLHLNNSLGNRLLTYTIADGLKKSTLKLQRPPKQRGDSEMELGELSLGLEDGMEDFDQFCLAPDGQRITAWKDFYPHVYDLTTGRFRQKFEPDDVHGCKSEYLQSGRLITVIYPPRRDRNKRVFLTRLKGKPLPKEGLRPLIAKLGSADGKERKSAERNILKYGQHALVPLRAVKTDDPEVTARIKGIVKAILANPPYDFIQCKFEIKANEYLSKIVPLRHNSDECLLLVWRSNPEKHVILHAKAVEDDLKILNVYGDDRFYGWVQGTPDGRIIALGQDGTVSVFRMSGSERK